MNGHLLTVFALLLGLACYVAGMTGAGMALFFVGAVLEIAFWLHTVQSPRRVSPRMLAKFHSRR
jgi:hypothetical protein